LDGRIDSVMFKDGFNILTGETILTYDDHGRLIKEVHSDNISGTDEKRLYEYQEKVIIKTLVKDNLEERYKCTYDANSSWTKIR
jgi:hypothetical protein